MCLFVLTRGDGTPFDASFILEEVAGVLNRKFGWSEERTSQVIRMLGDEATVVDPGWIPEVVEGNTADNRILGCAAEASADYLVTGDRRHLLPLGHHGDTRILNAPRFLSALERQFDRS